jgi:cysteine desulfurase
MKNQSKKDTSKPKPKVQKRRLIYLDNNSTTEPCSQALKAHMDWFCSFNPSSDSKIAKPYKVLLENAQELILNHCGVSSATHSVIFTSGASESNCYILRACAGAYKKKLIEKESSLLPHIIISATEHKTTMDCIKDLLELGDIQVSIVSPTIYGNVLPKDIEKEIRSNTCLISVMYANNEIPIINNIPEIGELAHRYKIPLHTDAVQMFGKYKIDVKRQHIDALSASAHKFYGPKGVGLLILNKDLIDGYKLTAQISGSQQHGLRGGTENIAGIASMLAAFKVAHSNRKTKNEKLHELRERLISALESEYKIAEYVDYLDDDNIYDTKLDKTRSKKEPVELIILGPPRSKKAFILPNTVLLAVCKNEGRPFCNVELKKYLDQNGVVVSIGSACNTDSPHASHVIEAIGAPSVVRRGVIRISLSDYTTAGEIDEAAKLIIRGIEDQCKALRH